MATVAVRPITAESLEQRERERPAHAEATLRRIETVGAPFTVGSVLHPRNELRAFKAWLA